jgi:hypothetical protein
MEEGIALPTEISLLFNLQAEEASEQNEEFLLSPLDEAMKIKEEYVKKVAEVKAKKQSKTLLDLDKIPVTNSMLLITTTLDDDQDWETIDKKWGPLPNGWEDKNYIKDDYPVLPPPPSPKTWEHLLQKDDKMEAGKILSKSPLNNVPIKTECLLLDIPSEIKEEIDALNDWPSTLLEGNNMHPPHLSFYRADPGEGWQYNRFRHLNYYWFLIPDLNFSVCQMVAP